MLTKLFAAAAATTLLVGCAYMAEPVAVESYDIATSYGSKLHGKYLLYVDGARLDTTVKPADMSCAAHTYPLVLSQPLADGMTGAFSSLVDELQVVTAPVASADLKAQGARGMITIQAQDVQASLRALPGYWSSGMDTSVQVIMSITVDGRSGRVFGTTVTGDGKGQGDAGFACDGGAKSLSDAGAQALRQAMTNAAEAVANSDRVRAM